MKEKRVISAALAAALLLALTACQTEGGASGSSSDPNSTAGVAVQVQKVASDTIAAGSSVSGRVTSGTGQETVFVSANARCTAVYVEEGDTIQAGEPICTLDMSDTLSSLETATTSYNTTKQSYQDQEALFNSQIALAERTVQDTMLSYEDQKALFDSQIALAEKNLSDLEALMEIGAAAQMEIDQARLSLQSLQLSKSSTLTQLDQAIQNAQSSIQSLKVSKTSTLAQLKSGMDSTKNSIDQLNTIMENVDNKGNVVAPISGTILSLNVAENSYAGPTAPVAVIDGVAQMEVAVSVSEALVPKLTLRDEVDVTISALGVTTVGTIREIGETASYQTKLYAVNIGLREPVDGLRVGMFADVSFRTEVSSNTIVVPTEAILSSNEEQYVFVVEDGKARYVSVTTGIAGNGVTEITHGLSAGDQLVTVGQAYLTDGAAVRVVSGEG